MGDGAVVEEKRDRFKLTPPQLILIFVLLLFAAVDVTRSITLLGAQPLGVDWSPLWAAARTAAGNPALIYDFAHITAAQEPLLGRISSLRPFVYPPSALPLFAPLALLPVLGSYAAWTATTGAFYIAASARIGANWWVLVLVPPVVLAALAGQTTFLLGGMILAGLLMLDEKPSWAGIILGVATAIKPQILVLLPLGLLLGRYWRPLFFWGVGGGAMVLLSLLLLGPAVWIEWAAALPRFQTLFESNPTLVNAAITPYAMAQRTGIGGPWVIAAAALPAILGIWATFRSGSCVSDRLIALVGGALLISPYAMNYELALLVPAIAAGARNNVRGAALLLVVGLSVPFGLGFWGLVAVMLSLAFNPRTNNARERINLHSEAVDQD
jgi:hypothetical protein